MIKDSGERTEFETGAVRDMHTGKGRMDLLPWRAIMEVSKHCEEGALKYGPHNVDRGIPVSSLFDSGVRHAAKWWLGIDDEDHLLAACWNFLWALEMMLAKPEMDNRYRECEAKPAPVKKTEKKPEKASAKKQPAPGHFAGYGAKLKKAVYEKLHELRKAGYTVGQLVALTGGAVKESEVMAMLNSQKIDFELWDAMANALSAAEQEVPVNGEEA